MGMYCDRCGRLLRPEASSCHHCDAPDAAATSAAANDPPTVPASPAAPAPSMRDLPSGVLAAAALCGISALLLLALGGLQLLLALLVAVLGYAPAAPLLFGAAWNVLLGVFFCVVAYWIARLHRRGYSWGLGSGVFNAGFIPLLMVFNVAN